MFVAFLESFKYVGHLVPLACLRVFLGGLFLKQGLLAFSGEFTQRAFFAEDIRSHLPSSSAPDWFCWALEVLVVPNWQVVALAISIALIAIGVSYTIGYLVRPAALVGAILSLFLIGSLGSGGQTSTLSAVLPTSLMFVLHLCLGWSGAGRCLGFDYFFYKRRRGLWW